MQYIKFLLVFNFVTIFYNKIQYNFNLIEHCLQSSAVYIETEHSLGFLWKRGIREV